jgi:eukaryotic-like serine/threonine-protein kinase
VNDAPGAAEAVPTRAAPRAGQIVGERYRLETLLERGAMGSVWRAEQIVLRAPVAVKFLDPSLLELPEMNRRFMQEARSAAAIRSVHVVQIFDYGSDDNVPFIAMEYLEGEDLDARLSSKGTLTPVELNKIFSEVARGIGQGHALGVIHRDLKPGNIFLAREGEHEITKVIDFGIAKVKVDAAELGKNMGTRLGTVLGTPQYMSPEQMRGSGQLDYRTDLWALAIIACECLTGRYPFTGKSLGDLTVQICTERPRAPSSLGPVPSGFDRWFFKATSKKPAQRFGSAEEMADALGAILLSTGELPPRPVWSERLKAASQSIGSRVSHISTLAAVFHGHSFALVSEPLRRAGPFVSRKRWLALLLVMCGFGPLVLLRPGTAPRALRVDGRAQPIEAAPLSPLPIATPPAAAPPAPVAAPAPPVAAPASPGDRAVPSAAGDSGSALATAVAPTAAPQPANGRVNRPRRKRPPPAAEANPLGAMSLAMGRAGASILAGDGMRREARARAAAAAEARARPQAAPAPRRPAPQR